MRAIPTDTAADLEGRLQAADRGLLLERVGTALAHEGKNPLHNISLHVQLLMEKMALPGAGARPGPGLDRHLQSIREGIGRVDALLKSFADFVVPGMGPADLAASAARAQLLFAFAARQANAEIARTGPACVLVAAPARPVSDLVCHALLAAIALARGGGHIALDLSTKEGRGRLDLTIAGGLGRREEAFAHLEAAHRLAAEAEADLQLCGEGSGLARLSLALSLAT